MKKPLATLVGCLSSLFDMKQRIKKNMKQMYDTHKAKLFSARIDVWRVHYVCVNVRKVSVFSTAGQTMVLSRVKNLPLLF